MESAYCSLNYYNFSDFTKPVSDALGDRQIDKAEIA